MNIEHLLLCVSSQGAIKKWGLTQSKILWINLLMFMWIDDPRVKKSIICASRLLETDQLDIPLQISECSPHSLDPDECFLEKI